MPRTDSRMVRVNLGAACLASGKAEERGVGAVQAS